MIHQIEAIELTLNLILMLYAMDIALSGFMVLVRGESLIEKPKSLGLLIMQWMHRSGARMQGRNALVDFLFRTKVMSAYFLFYGLMLTWLAASDMVEMLR